MDLVEQEGLRQLGLGKGGLHFQDGLVGKHGGPLGDSPDIAREAEVGQIVQKRPGKGPQRGQVVQGPFRKAQGFKVFEGGFQTRGQQVIAVFRKPPEEQVEHGRLLKILLQVGLHHG